MRINSDDGKSWLEIELGDDDDYPTFTLRTFVEIGHGRFSGENGDVCFLNMAEFSDDLDRFILDRSIVPQLLGSNDSCVKISQGRTLETILCNFTLGDACWYSTKTVFDYRLSGTIAIRQEDLNGIVAFCRNPRLDT
jgi:hypothetical protein